MKKNYLIFCFCMIFLLASMSFVHSEEYLYNNIIKDTNASLVKQHFIYTFDDTSASGVGKDKPIIFVLWWNVQALPFDLSEFQGGQVDYCNLTINNIVNTYGTGVDSGHLLNTSETTTSYYFTTGAVNSSKVIYQLKDKDMLIGDMSCHYTNYTNLYGGNILVGQITTFSPSYECSACSDTSLQEQFNQIKNDENITQQQLSMYSGVQQVIGWNFQLWLIFSWILKIFFVFAGVGLIFATFYFFYKVINDLIALV